MYSRRSRGWAHLWSWTRAHGERRRQIVVYNTSSRSVQYLPQSQVYQDAVLWTVVVEAIEKMIVVVVSGVYIHFLARTWQAMGWS